ncbi:septum formation family protein [Nanchangia anserum]|uniref:Septum formation family protein n=1 Tax=Nanchangia anserum TaxID=2692125 RepID=A0A8I0GAX8_9ACTO|nr:septum formation family protein [Nanchangia anserum]MBD3689443.1 septum formation family protein [Nanchangia anserum]QOX81643.1 septum formation family protein [Nanchangia anserum]
MSTPRRILAALACAVVGGGVLTGCSSATYTLKAGDCFTASDDILTGSADIADVDTVSCTRSHNSEVVGSHVVTDSSFPGTETLVTRAQTLCQKDFLDYVGIDYTKSAYDLYPLIPTKDTWTASSARSITCVALALPPIDHSLKGQGEAAATRATR